MKSILLFFVTLYCIYAKAQSVIVPTAPGSDNSYKAASTQWVQAELSSRQPLSTILSTIAGLTLSNDAILQVKAGAITQRTPAQVKTDLAIVQSDIPSLVSDIAGKQASDADLTTIAGITPSNDGIMQVKASAWTIRTPAQVKTDLVIVQGDIPNLTSDIAAKAPLASPTFTGTPLSTTAAFATNTTQIATTAYVVAQRPVWAYVSGSNATTTGQALADIAGLTVALTTNATYYFEANLTVSTSAVTTGTQYAINYSVASGTVEAVVSGAVTSTSSSMTRMSALNTATATFLTTSAQSGGIRITGRVTTGANAGNLVVRHLKVTSGTSTVFIGSSLKVERVL